MRKEKGSIGSFLAACVSILMLSVLLVSFLDCVKLMESKKQVDQIARKYILRMETVGLLEADDKTALLSELRDAGATNISLDGTTLVRVGYGKPLVLHIHGKLGENNEFDEKKVSTAKN